MTEQFVNKASTTLNGTISSGATSLTVNSATAFPSTGNFRLLVESEYMIVTGVSGNNFTVTRGAEGSTAVGHNNGVVVSSIVTAGAVAGLAGNISNYGTYANRPVAGAYPGSRYTCSDGPTPFLWTGSVWIPDFGGLPTGSGEVAPSNVSPFTLTTPGSNLSTVTVAGGCVALQCTDAGILQNFQMLEVPRSGAHGPQAGLIIDTQQAGSVGVYVRDSSGGKILAFGVDVNTNTGSPGQWTVIEMTNATTYNSSPYPDAPFGSIRMPVFMWLRNDGTNYNAEFSTNFGMTWTTLYNQPVSSWVPSAGDKCGVYVNPYSAKCGATVLAWSVQ